MEEFEFVLYDPDSGEITQYKVNIPPALAEYIYSMEDQCLDMKEDLNMSRLILDAYKNLN